jgi:hypothetical protein
MQVKKQNFDEKLVSFLEGVSRRIKNYYSRVTAPWPLVTRLSHLETIGLWKTCGKWLYILSTFWRLRPQL